MEHTLKGRLIANTLRTGTDQESLLQLTIVGNLTLTDLIDKMKEEDTGLRRETIEHVVSLYHRVVEDAVLNGYHINTGLYCAQPQARGYIVNNAWNPEKNTIHVSLTPGKELRQAAARTHVDIRQGGYEKRYIAGVEDTATQATNGSATPGRTLILRGQYLKIVGDPAQVGLTLVSHEGVETCIPMEMIAINHPKQVAFLVPANLAKGTYTVTLATQFSNNPKRLLKKPRVLRYAVYVAT